MEETYVQLSYYQKSMAFLYPILGYHRANETYKCATYLFFLHHNVANGDIVVRYDHDGGALYQAFESNRITSHPLLRSCYKIQGGSVYVFDISKWMKDIDQFLAGEYSAMSNDLKKLVLRFHNDDIMDTRPAPGRWTHAVLFPNLYRDLVAKQLGFENSKEMPRELGPKYDLDQETLEVDAYTFCGHTNPTTTLIKHISPI